MQISIGWESAIEYNHDHKLRRAFLQGKLRVRVGLLFLACAVSTACGQLRFAASGPVILRDGAGSAVFTVTNAGSAAIPLALRTGPFSDDTTQLAIADPKVTFAGASGGALPAIVIPGATVRVNASISGLSGASLAGAPLLNGNKDLGRLHAMEADSPLNISVSGDGAFNKELVLTDGDDAALTLKNDDSEAYPLDWAFQIDGKTMQSGELQLGPHGISRLMITPTDDFYSWRDDVRPSMKEGTLLLALHGPPEVARELMPERTLQVNVVLRKLSPVWTSFWSRVFVMVLLLAGGLLSVTGNSVLPNALRKINLRRQLNALSERTGSISTRVDPHLRELLRLERKRLDMLLARVWSLSLTAVETLDEVTTGIERLSKRLKVTERLDELRRRLEDVAMTTPPSVTDDIDTKLQTAAGHLHLFALTDEEVNAANGALDRAYTVLESLGNTENLARMIAGNFRDLKVRQKFLPYSYYNDLKTALPGLFEMLNQPFDDFRNIPRQMIFAIDFGISALQLAFDYAVMRESTAAAVVPASAGAAPAAGNDGQSARDRLISHQKELVGLLGTLSWSALRELRALVQEMREGIYERDLLKEIATPGQAEIVLDPQTVRPYHAVLFSIRFKDARFNDASAMRRLSCKWDFPGHLVEQDWKIYHFFKGNEAKRNEEGPDVPVEVIVESQKPVETSAVPEGKAARPLRSMLSTTFEIRKGDRSSYSRAFAESVRFLIAFGVTLAALLAGALQELEKLDFLPAVIAILALGFAADSVKNLLSQSGKRSAA